MASNCDSNFLLDTVRISGVTLPLWEWRCLPSCHLGLLQTANIACAVSTHAQISVPYSFLIVAHVSHGCDTRRRELGSSTAFVTSQC